MDAECFLFFIQNVTNLVGESSTRFLTTDLPSTFALYIWYVILIKMCMYKKFNLLDIVDLLVILLPINSITCGTISSHPLLTHLIE